MDGEAALVGELIGRIPEDFTNYTTGGVTSPEDAVVMLRRMAQANGLSRDGFHRYDEALTAHYKKDQARSVQHSARQGVDALFEAYQAFKLAGEGFAADLVGGHPMRHLRMALELGIAKLIGGDLEQARAVIERCEKTRNTPTLVIDYYETGNHAAGAGS